jgi:hypothetical protein
MGALWLDGPWTVPCPRCFAKVDAPCYGPRKERGKVSGYHADRVDVWSHSSAARRTALAELHERELKP